MEFEKTNKEIYTTTDYSIFKKLLGNRGITETRVNSIIDSIKAVGYHPIPILVNDKMEIIDGQGRVEACSRLGLPVEFIVDKEANIDTCISMNIRVENWKVMDFIDSYAERGVKDYTILKKEIDEHDYLSPITIAEAFSGSVNNSGVNKRLRNGEYIIIDYSMGIKCLSTFEAIHDSIEKMNCKKSTIYSVLQGLIVFDLIDIDRMIESINKFYDRCGYIGDVASALDSLQEIYNFNRRSRHYFKDNYRQKMEERSINNLNSRKNIYLDDEEYE